MTEQQSNIIIYDTNDGKNYNVTFYSLEMILAVGYRVRGKRGYAKFDARRKKIAAIQADLEDRKMLEEITHKTKELKSTTD